MLLLFEVLMKMASKTISILHCKCETCIHIYTRTHYCYSMWLQHGTNCTICSSNFNWNGTVSTWRFHHVHLHRPDPGNKWTRHNNLSKWWNMVAVYAWRLHWWK